jgi:ABC-type iron transport system FetAB permease component
MRRPVLQLLIILYQGHYVFSIHFWWAMLNKLLPMMSNVSMYSNINVTSINTKVEKLSGSGVYVNMKVD